METKDAIVLKTAKDFPAPIDRLYSAWTTPDQLKQWWHPMENELKEVTIDLKEGGNFRYVFHDKHDKPVLEISGQYEEVKTNDQLTYSWNWSVPDQPIQDSRFRLIITFQKLEKGSRLQVIQENFASEESIHPHYNGWNKALESLHTYLSSGK